MDRLTQAGPRIVDEQGRVVVLRRLNLGGWLNMENYIVGFPGAETDMRRALRDVLGASTYEAISDAFLGAFFDEPDAAFIGSLGANLLRVPIKTESLRHRRSPAWSRDVRRPSCGLGSSSCGGIQGVLAVAGRVLGPTRRWLRVLS